MVTGVHKCISSPVVNRSQILNGEPFANIANVRNAEQLADFAHASDNLRLATAAAVVAAAVSFVSREALGNRYKERSCLP